MKTLLMTMLLGLLISFHYLPANAQTAELDKFIYLPIVQKPSWPSIGGLTRITTASMPYRDSLNVSLSADGTKMVFDSTSDLLNQGIPEQEYNSEIWMYDATTSNLTRITTASEPYRWSANPQINADGTKVVFSSDSDFLNEGPPLPPPPGQMQIWLYDTTVMTLTRLTFSSTYDRSSNYPTLSADGSKIAFVSNSNLLSQGNTSYWDEVWLYDTTTMTLTRVTTASEMRRWTAFPNISADGSKIVFYSNADFLNEGIPQHQIEIWLYDITTANLSRITTATDAERDSLNPKISADGSKIVFDSDADFLNEGVPNDQIEIWMYDTIAMTFTRITAASSIDRDSLRPAMNADGTKVIFQSDSDFLNQGIPDRQVEVWLYDTIEMTYTRITTSPPFPAEIYRPYPYDDAVAISADGSHIAFESNIDLINQSADMMSSEIWWANLEALSAWPTLVNASNATALKKKDNPTTYQPHHKPFNKVRQQTAW